MILAHDRAGDGNPVLLLHSGVCDRRMWTPQWEPLSAGARLIRCDLRGHGDSPPATEPWNDAEDVLALLDALDVTAATVVGSSFGGKVALELAARWPDRVAALALLCTAAPDYPPTAAAEEFDEREEALLSTGEVDAAVELNVRTWLGPEATAETREQVALMQRRVFEQESDVEPIDRGFDIGDITAPALVVSGALDLDHFRAIAADLAARLPEARAVELPWAAHLPSLERPDEVTALLAEFCWERP